MPGCGSRGTATLRPGALSRASRLPAGDGSRAPPATHARTSMQACRPGEEAAAHNSGIVPHTLPESDDHRTLHAPPGGWLPLLVSAGSPAGRGLVTPYISVRAAVLVPRAELFDGARETACQMPEACVRSSAHPGELLVALSWRRRPPPQDVDACLPAMTMVRAKQGTHKQRCRCRRDMHPCMLV